MSYLNYPKVEETEFIQLISDAIKIESHSAIFVGCNNIRTLIKLALSTTENEKSVDVYVQRNNDFVEDMEISEIMTYDVYKTRFEDYCNYFDKHKTGVVNRSVKKLYNYSKDAEEISFTEYPNDIKMILIIANFNLLDLKSQCVISSLQESHKNIIVIGQLRNDFDFAIKHLDSRLHGRGAFCYLEENLIIKQ